MKIEFPTYVIAELEGEVCHVVTDCRRKFNPQAVDWPVDITIAGSSGVGPVSIGQSLESVVEKLSPIFKMSERFTFDFLSVRNFPNSGVYYFEPERERFDSLHELAINCDVKFEANRFSYNPHCTLRFGSTADAGVEKYLYSLKPPKVVNVKCFSIYQVNQYEAKRLHKFQQ